MLLFPVAAEASAPALRVHGRWYDWDTFALFVMPGETLEFSTADDANEPGWMVERGRLTAGGAGRIDWVAPERAGLYTMTVTCDSTLKRVHLFVKMPFDSVRDGVLNGYRLGRYPESNPFPAFTAPEGFLEITPEMLDTPLSPRYTLRQFVPNLPSGFPKYIVLQEKLIIKLELLTDLIVSKGHECDRLTIMSGFRTPTYQYRRGAGKHSAHMYGGASDIYVDNDNNGAMDDLTGDGSSNSHDSRLLAGYVEELEQAYPELVGGCGWYRRTRVRGPFIHIDVRGERTRWHQ